MFDPVQIILLVFITILTILLVILGIQVYFILRDLRTTIDKTNKVLDNTNRITESVATPAEGLSSFVMGLKASAGIATVLGLLKNIGMNNSSKGDSDGE
ncbi:hypothetical protein E6Q11_00725 [Candidatus Dojkabacteria bacterium]|uniref:DUF948 domain-containing protein n=1 Tax=Candidatus Dojkabacteria bacterium TaxID=2099670 RepID=A0A5C7JC68_9BACT|nr:MAG: hypothetical protein E6Q11_00725 [Candidatus Dojkabacteria bacterium]